MSSVPVRLVAGYFPAGLRKVDCCDYIVNTLDPAQPQPDVTQLHPSSPGSGSSTPLYELAEFDSTACVCVVRRCLCGALCKYIETLDGTCMSTQTASIL